MALDFPDAPVADEVFVTPKTNFIWLIAPDRWCRQKPGVSITLTSIVPDTAEVLEQPLTEFNGTGFTPASTINFGPDVLTPTFISDTQLTATLASTQPDSSSLSVRRRRHLQRAAVYLDGTAAGTPLLYSVVPAYDDHRGDASLAEVKLRSDSVAEFNSVAVPTTYISATELDAIAPIEANAVAGGSRCSPIP
jgi:hypothetical protein